MSKKATAAALAGLHEKLATVLTEAVSFRDEDGQPVAALLNVARQFLKDNKIEADDPAGSPMGRLKEALPEFDDDPAGDMPGAGPLQ